MTRVQLAVYDLSNGMAQQLSQAILGQRIDGIWHTGILVYGREYFFGGGIQSLPIGSFTTFNGLRPVETVDLGETTKSQAEFEQFLRSIRHRFTQATYDLINNNCNNFSNEVAIFLIGRGIPSHIVDLPRIVFSTPGGAMLRPMIEGMQNTIRDQTSVGTLDPFGAAAGSSPASPAARQSLTPLKEASFVSEDRTATTIASITSRIINYVPKEGEPLDVITSDVRQYLSSLQELLSSNQLSQPMLYVELLEKILRSYPSLQLSCLFLLRLIFLSPQLTDAAYPLIETVITKLHQQTYVSAPSLIMAYCTVANVLSHRVGCNIVFAAECCENNLNRLIDAAVAGLSHERSDVRQAASALAYNIALFATQWEIDVLKWSPPHVEISEEELHHHIVQLLCGALENLHEDPDAESVRRRLLTAYRTCRAGGVQARELMMSLGFDAVLHEINGGSLDDYSKNVCGHLKEHLKA